MSPPSSTAPQQESVESGSDVTVQPDITCQRCGTVTTWNPYCPTCNAYLEFAGTPPWQPNEVVSILPPAGDAHSDSIDADSTSGADKQSDGSPASAQILAVAMQVPENNPNVSESDHHHRLALGHFSWREAGNNPWWAWWRKKGKYVKAAPVEAAVATSDESSLLADSAESLGSSQQSFVTPGAPISDIHSELPEIQLPEQQRTRAQLQEGYDFVAHGTTCAHCHKVNPPDLAYCKWCGSYLNNFLLAPNRQIRRSTDPKKDAEPGLAPSRVSKWRTPLIIAFVCLLAGTIWFLFWGPPAFEVRSGIRVAYQKVEQYLSPEKGTMASVADGTATSTLAGTEIETILGMTANTYWSSEQNESFGAGTSITVEFTDTFTIDRMSIRPGMQNGEQDVISLAQPKSITLEFSPQNKFETTLKQIESKNDYSQIVQFPAATTREVTITINSVFKPRRATTSDVEQGSVAISQIYFLQEPSASTINAPISPLAPSPSPTPSSSPKDETSN